MAERLTWDAGHMDQLGEAVKAFKAAQASLPGAQQRADKLVADARGKIDDTRKALAAAIVEEYQNGARVSDLARRTEYNRESIRRILRTAGVEAE